LGISSFISSGHYLLAFIAVIGILSQVLCVTLSSIAFNPAILYSAYNVCTWISVAILVVMLLALTFVFFYREPIMPFKPDTVAGNLVYLCDGSLADMLKDLGGQDTKERNQRINRMGLRYEMGYAPGSGANRLVVLAMGGGGIA
jgi:magnesium-transporting ATPase (P-type)